MIKLAEKLLSWGFVFLGPGSLFFPGALSANWTLANGQILDRVHGYSMNLAGTWERHYREKLGYFLEGKRRGRQYRIFIQNRGRAENLNREVATFIREIINDQRFVKRQTRDLLEQKITEYRFSGTHTFEETPRECFATILVLPDERGNTYFFTVLGASEKPPPEVDQNFFLLAAASFETRERLSTSPVRWRSIRDQASGVEFSVPRPHLVFTPAGKNFFGNQDFREIYASANQPGPLGVFRLGAGKVGVNTTLSRVAREVLFNVRDQTRAKIEITQTLKGKKDLILILRLARGTDLYQARLVLKREETRVLIFWQEILGSLPDRFEPLLTSFTEKLKIIDFRHGPDKQVTTAYRKLTIGKRRIWLKLPVSGWKLLSSKKANEISFQSNHVFENAEEDRLLLVVSEKQKARETLDLYESIALLNWRLPGDKLQKLKDIAGQPASTFWKIVNSKYDYRMYLFIRRYKKHYYQFLYSPGLAFRLRNGKMPGNGETDDDKKQNEKARGAASVFEEESRLRQLFENISFN